MARFICGFFPKFKLHKVCADDGLRPAMGYLYFSEGKVYATNAHMAIAAQLSFISTFSDDEQEMLDGKLIHATQFAQLLKMRETRIKETADGVQFECKTIANETVIIPLLTEETIGKFPNVEKVLENARINAKENKKPISYIGLNTSMLADLASAMNAKIVNLYFSDAAQAITIQDGVNTCNEIRAIIIPCLVTDPKF